MFYALTEPFLSLKPHDTLKVAVMKKPIDGIKSEFRKETLRIPQEQQWTQTFQTAMALFNKGETKT